MYATTQDYINRFSAKEAAELLVDFEPWITADDLSEAVNGNLSDDEDVAKQQQAAIARLETALNETTLLMNGYISSTNTLPLSDVTIAANPLMSCCAELARCSLMDQPDNHTELSDSRCQNWMRWLRDIAASKVRLLQPTDEGASSAANETRSGTYDSQYDWSSFGGGS